MEDLTRQHLTQEKIVDELIVRMNSLDFFDKMAEDMDNAQFDAYWNEIHNRKEHNENKSKERISR